MRPDLNNGTEIPTIEPNVVRLVVLDASERVLLLHVRDLSNRAFGVAVGGVALATLTRDAGLVFGVEFSRPPSG